MNVVLAQTYPGRIDAVEALGWTGGPADGERLRTCAAQIAGAADIYDLAPAAADWRLYAAALEVAALLTDWEQASLAAESDADRFLRAARLRSRALAKDAKDTAFGKMLIESLAPIDEAIEPDDVGTLRNALARLPLPAATFSKPDRFRHLRGERSDPKPEPEDVAVAFLEFTIDGKPAESLHSLSAGQVHDLDLMIRVSRWPEGAERLVIAPVSIEPVSMWDFPAFSFTKPAGEPPYTFERQGRMLLQGSHGLSARPLEFRYAAQFEPPTGWEQRVVVAGQRTLRLTGTDTSQRGATGYGEIDAKIVELRERLRIEPLVSERDLIDLLAVLAPIGNLMGQAVQDKRYPKPIDEAAFQKDVQEFLRVNTAIGQELEVQSQVAGGKVDLSFRGIRIELKAEREKKLIPSDCRSYAQQAASYAVGSGRRLALLVVLDSSPKHSMPFPAADGLIVIPVETDTSPVYVVTCLLQGGFARPSDLSR